MRNEIFNQIEKNRSSFYNQLNHLKKDTIEIISKSDNDIEQETQEETGKGINSFSVLLNILYQKFSGINIPKINSLKFAKKSKKQLMEKTSIISQFSDKLNQNLTRKTDSIIEQFYNLGSRIFEDNTESSPSYSSKLEVIPVASSQNNGGSKMNFELALDTNPIFDISGIVKTFKTFQKNLLIYLESDSFTFTQPKSKDSNIKGKEISYENDVENSEGNKGTAVFKKILKSKIIHPIQKYRIKKSINWMAKIIVLKQQISELNHQFLFPSLNRFILKNKLGKLL